MATKVKAQAVKESVKDEPKAADAPEKEEATSASGPLLDLSDAAVKKMIKQAKKRGFVTFDQLNDVLPSESTSPEQIEDVMSMLSRDGHQRRRVRGCRGRRRGEAGRARRGARYRARRDHPARRRRDQEVRARRAHRRSRAHVSARDGLGRAAVARGRNRDRQAHRGRPRGDDRGPLRKPADLPGHHHLARRAQRGKDFPARHHRPRGDLCRSRGARWRQSRHRCRRRCA